MAMNTEKFSSRDKQTFNLIFNSSLKRHLIGIHFLILKRVIQNANFNSISFYEFLKESGSKAILTQEYLKKSLENEKDSNTLDLLFSYKIIQPINPSSDNFDFLSLEEIINSSEKFQFANGIEFAEKIFKTSSGELAISLGSLNTLLNRWLDQKIQQNKLQKSTDELHTVPSRIDPHYFHYFLTQVDSKNNPGFTKKKSDVYYSLTDKIVDYLNTYHPLPGEISEGSNGELFLKLVEISIKLETIVKQSESLQEKSKKCLKILDSDMFHKSIISLSERIVLRELIISSLTDIVRDKSRSSIFLQKLRDLSDNGIVAWQIVKEAEMTAKSLPKVFEHVEYQDSPVGAVGNWMVAFSRIMVAYLLNKAIKQSLEGKDALFNSEIGSNVMVELYEWSNNSTNIEILDQIQDLVIEGKALSDFYSSEELQEIRKNYLNSS
ncbi:MAG: hypothetical protein HeimC3_17830 [Candidatus Heimdallarchaeota archaeon LC_3]|nr:MAG: hypothetical protein HeimC3_17830 [Candidatus Heimdallarchaeota archaeon LC_3]